MGKYKVFNMRKNGGKCWNNFVIMETTQKILLKFLLLNHQIMKSVF